MATVLETLAVGAIFSGWRSITEGLHHSIIARGFGIEYILQNRGTMTIIDDRKHPGPECIVSTHPSHLQQFVGETCPRPYNPWVASLSAHLRSPLSRMPHSYFLERLVL